MFTVFYIIIQRRQDLYDLGTYLHLLLQMVLMEDFNDAKIYTILGLVIFDIFSNIITHHTSRFYSFKFLVFHLSLLFRYNTLHINVLTQSPNLYIVISIQIK